ncbi:MAG: TolC family protein [Thermoanaerobaculia bacterium]
MPSRSYTARRVPFRLAATVFAFVAFSIFAGALAAQVSPAPMTLDEVLRSAREANAALRLPGYDVAIARQKRREALAVNELRVLFSGDLIVAPPSGYDPAITNLGEERAQVIATRPILDAGARRAEIAAANAALEGARAAYRIAECDLDLEVRNSYIDARDAQREIETRRTGVEQLHDYRLLLQSLHRGGMPVGPEILRLDLRIAGEEASILQAEARKRQAIQILNDLMGRTPDAPLDLAPLPPLVSPGTMPAGASPQSDSTNAPGNPSTLPHRGGVAFALAPPAESGGSAPLAPPSPSAMAHEEARQGSGESGSPSSPAMTLPETASALAQIQSAEAALLQTRAEHGFRLDLTADAGLWGSDTAHLVPPDLGSRATPVDRLQRDLGYSLTVDFSLPLRDKTYAARLAQARLGVEQARESLTVAQRNAILQQSQALTALRDAYREVELLRSTTASARDAWIESKSRYLGGAVPFVDVSDAYASWIDSELGLANAERRYREAEALLMRWTSSK